MGDFLNPNVPLGNWVADGIDWFRDTFPWLLSATKVVLEGMYDGLFWLLSTPLYLIMIVIFAALAWFVSGWRLALFTAIAFYLIRAFDQWTNAMSTLALVLVTCLFAIIISIPIGVLAAKSSTVSSIVKPILDFMQSMPALAYLVPAIVMFGIGIVPGAIATIIFSLPPGVRLTELAIRGVDKDVVEAANSFGASPSHVLFRVQFPLAMPTIMAGVNQVIMLALSMVVLAGMAGAGGLGGDVITSITRTRVALGVEAGLAVVFIAIYLDRITGVFGRQGDASAR